MYWHVGQVVGAIVMTLGLLYGAGVIYAMARDWINDADHGYREDVPHPVFPFEWCEFTWGDRVEAAIVIPLGMAIIALVSVPLWPVTVGVAAIVTIMHHLRNERRKQKA